MNKDEMIEDKEQMARIIAFDLCGQSYHSNWWGNEAQCYSENNFHDCKKIKAVVDKLYNEGYRKVADDEIVESMKTYERARRETAREILKYVKFNERLTYRDPDGNYNPDPYAIGAIIKEEQERTKTKYTHRTMFSYLCERLGRYEDLIEEIVNKYDMELKNTTYSEENDND